MKSTRVAGRYSKALLDLALEQKTLEEAKNDALVVLDAIKESRDLRNLLMSPVVKPSQKNTILTEVFGKHVSELTMRFVQLVVKHGRDKDMDTIFDQFMNHYREHMNIVEVEVTTSTKVSATVIADIVKKLESSTGKTVEVVERVDEDLIGGYVVDMTNYRLDASLATGMKKLKRELVK